MDARVPDDVDAKTGLNILSLYGATRRPTPAMLEGLDTVVVDLQDAGVRFYTYATTMAYLMESAAENGIKVMVLDRPNPINGVEIEGPLLDRSGFWIHRLSPDAGASRPHAWRARTAVQRRAGDWCRARGRSNAGVESWHVV